MNGPLDGIYRLKNGVRTRRVSSYDRSGSNKDFMPVDPGATAVLADIPGAGIVKRIWFTLDCADPMIRRNAVLRMYWDGETAPSVESPLGDFFGQGWGEAYNYVSLPLAAAPSDGRGLNCYFPMPFGDGARITLHNESDEPIRAFFYYIDYEEYAEISAELGRFHARWNRELTEVHPEEGETEWQIVAPEGNNTGVDRNYVFADIEGKGHFVGLHYFVENPGPMWYGEGDDMWLVDGEPWPGSLHGTGTEDFFGGAWCPNEIYLHPYFGYARIPDKYAWMGRTHCYRFMLEDPVYFERSLHASIEHGHNNNLTLDLCTVSYWYQTEPHKPYPALPGRDGRQNMPEIWAADIHNWRHHWRQAMGGGRTLWGNERQPREP